MNRRDFLQSMAMLAGVGLGSGIGDSDEEERLLEEAERGIWRYRRSPGVVRVLDAAGQPLAGARVRVEQVRHEFLFGANLFLWQPSPESDVQLEYRRRFAGLFNQATLGFYWASFEPRRGEPRYAETDAVVDWCRSQGIVCKGHPLAWANIPDPEWLPRDLAEIRTASLGRVREIVGRYRGRIDVWDVVNEPSLLLWAATRYGEWAQSVGTQAFVGGHLRAAREANPEATLLVNEVLTEYPSYSLLRELEQDGVIPYDAVGIQSHMHQGLWSLRSVREVCDRYAALGVPLHFSEVAVPSGIQDEAGRWLGTSFEYETLQRDYVPRLYTLLFGHPALRGICWWDLSDRGAWKGIPTGLLREDMSPKPVYEQLEGLIKERWWTRVDGETDAAGELRLRAFHGRQQVAVEALRHRPVTREVRWMGGRENLVEMKMTGRAGDGP